MLERRSQWAAQPVIRLVVASGAKTESKSAGDESSASRQDHSVTFPIVIVLMREIADIYAPVEVRASRAGCASSRRQTWLNQRSTSWNQLVNSMGKVR